MKFLDLSRASANDSTEFPALTIATDSAIETRGLPLFLPDYADSFDCEVLTVYRISRLGKSVGRRFASRYYDAMTLMGRLVGKNPELPPESPWLTATDFAMALGRWIDIPQPGTTVRIEGPQFSISQILPDCAPIDEAIEKLSRFFTLKNGDIIAPSAPLARFPVKIDTRVTAATPQGTILTFKIK